MRIGAIVLAGGRGRRMEMSLPKQYLLLGGKPVIAYSLEAMEACDAITDVVLVCDGEGISSYKKEIGGSKYSKLVSVTEGGETRGDSTLAGLCAMPKEVEYVLIQDGARPLLTQDLMERVIAGMQEQGACVPGVPVTDTIKQVDQKGMVKSTLERDDLRSIQTPQGFQYSKLLLAYQIWKKKGRPPITDDASVWEQFGPGPVFLTEGNPTNYKLTTREDMEKIEAELERKKSAPYPEK